MTSYSKNKNGPFSILTFLFLLAVAVLGMNFPTRANADDCVALGGVLNAGECQISGNQVKSNASCAGGVSCQLDQTLHFLNPSSLTVSPQSAGLTLNITGDLIMEPGSKINGDVAGSATAANITVNATGNIILKQGVGLTPGAIITASQPTGSCTAAAKAGNITLNADVDGNFIGDVDIQGNSSANPDDRAKVLANGCSGGEIIITGVKINNDGLVESFGRVSGTGAVQRPGGGPITLDAECELVISDSGKVSSRGVDPGADLVHLEGGCVVEINGLVESTGIGHGIPNTPPNRCNNTTRPDKPSNSAACVEVWAGESLIINSISPHNGEVKADTGGPGGSTGTGWIDIFARGDIEIVGPTVTTEPFAVHANGLANTNDVGGLIDIESIEGEVTASGRAVQANATGSGGKGGTVTIEAKLDVNVQGGIVEAKGATGGGAPAGGKIFVRSWGEAPSIGSIVSDANSTLDVTGGLAGNPATFGAITLTACDAIGFPPGVTLPATVTPTKTTGVCGGNPELPLGANTYVVLPICPPECGLFGLCACINNFTIVGAPPLAGSTMTLTGDSFIGADPANPNIKTVGFNATCVPNPLCTVAVTPTSDTSITLIVPACALSGDRVIVGLDGNPSFSCSVATLP